jgi:hypothetical protein
MFLISRLGGARTVIAGKSASIMAFVTAGSAIAAFSFGANRALSRSSVVRLSWKRGTFPGNDRGVDLGLIVARYY